MGYQPATYKIIKIDGLYELYKRDGTIGWKYCEGAHTNWGIKRALHRNINKKPEQIIGYFNSEGKQLYE